MSSIAGTVAVKKNPGTQGLVEHGLARRYPARRRCQWLNLVHPGDPEIVGHYQMKEASWMSELLFPLGTKLRKKGCTSKKKNMIGHPLVLTLWAYGKLGDLP
jgi:hypothetical protein